MSVAGKCWQAMNSQIRYHRKGRRWLNGSGGDGWLTNVLSILSTVTVMPLCCVSHGEGHVLCGCCWKVLYLAWRVVPWSGSLSVGSDLST